MKPVSFVFLPDAHLPNSTLAVHNRESNGPVQCGRGLLQHGEKVGIEPSKEIQISKIDTKPVLRFSIRFLLFRDQKSGKRPRRICSSNRVLINHLLSWSSISCRSAYGNLYGCFLVVFTSHTCILRSITLVHLK